MSYSDVKRLAVQRFLIPYDSLLMENKELFVNLEDNHIKNKESFLQQTIKNEEENHQCRQLIRLVLDNQQNNLSMEPFQRSHADQSTAATITNSLIQPNICILPELVLDKVFDTFIKECPEDDRINYLLLSKGLFGYIGKVMVRHNTVTILGNSVEYLKRFTLYCPYSIYRNSVVYRLDINFTELGIIHRELSSRYYAINNLRALWTTVNHLKLRISSTDCNVYGSEISLSALRSLSNVKSIDIVSKGSNVNPNVMVQVMEALKSLGNLTMLNGNDSRKELKRYETKFRKLKLL